ncbi:MAG: hypothetical protein JXR86_19335 [Spirochaetales bacterium]|nr:hypothetical protein [Spirochaetales bacterium]
MKKFFALLSALLFFLISCDGPLWNGSGSAGENELVVRISNPFASPESEQSSRMLALHGRALYIELAVVKDRTGYVDDEARALTGDGTWMPTSWGGHAIVVVDLNSWTTSVEAVFTDVPVDQEITARGYLDTDRDHLEEGVSPWPLDLPGRYGLELLPICTTVNFDSSTGIFEDDTSVSVPAEELDAGVVNLTLLPVTPLYDPIIGPNGIAYNQTDAYIDSSAVSILYSEPFPGQTAFSLVSLELGTGSAGTVNLQDVAFYMSVEADLEGNPPLPGITTLYDTYGEKSQYIGDTPDWMNPGYPFRSLQMAYPELDASYMSLDPLFISSTIFGEEGVNDMAQFPGGPYGPSDYYNVSYGLVYDEYPSINPDNSNVFEWTLPPGFETGDLAFKVVQLSQGNLPDTAVDSVEEINALITAGLYDVVTVDLSGSFYANTPGILVSGSGKRVIILAHEAGNPDAPEFIFASTTL